MTTQKVTARQGASGGSSSSVFTNLIALTTLVGLADKQAAYIQGGITPGDGGGGNFWWNATSTATPDGINIVQVTGVATGRWIKSLQTPVLQIKGTVSGVVSMDLSVAQYFKMSAATNVTISLLNVITPSFILIEFNHTAAGTTITNLPGKLLSDFSWSPGINDITMLYGVYNGTEWKWSSSLYQVPTLGNVLGFTAVPSGTTIINLSWTSVANATAYIIDRATNVGFTTGVTLGIYSSNGTSFSDTGLPTATQFFYRIRATAVGYNDSAYSTASGTTGTVLVDLLFPTQVSLANVGTVWNGTDTGTNFNCFGLSNVKLPSGVNGWIQHTYSAADANAGMLAFSTLNTNKKYTAGQYGAAVFFSGGNVWQIDNGAVSGTNTGVTMATGNMIRIRRTGSVLTIEKSTDSGVTWPTLVYTFTFTSAVDLFININIERVGALNKVYDPKGFAVI